MVDEDVLMCYQVMRSITVHSARTLIPIISADEAAPDTTKKQDNELYCWGFDVQALSFAIRDFGKSWLLRLTLRSECVFLPLRSTLWTLVSSQASWFTSMSLGLGGGKRSPYQHKLSLLLRLDRWPSGRKRWEEKIISSANCRRIVLSEKAETHLSGSIYEMTLVEWGTRRSSPYNDPFECPDVDLTHRLEVAKFSWSIIYHVSFSSSPPCKHWSWLTS